MPTKGQEDYLKIIFDENLKQNKITNKFISEELDIKAPSVTHMLQRLEMDGLIEKNDKLGFKLTLKGEEKTKILLSKHRLWELFLIEYLGYTWDEVHKDADLLEHVTSDNLFKKLNIFLKKPKRCPHGKPIYINDDNTNDLLEKKLSELQIGDVRKINVIEDSSKLLKYLSEKNINLNDTFKLISINEFDKSFTINLNNNNVTISHIAANKIYVKEIN